MNGGLQNPDHEGSVLCIPKSRRRRINRLLQGDVAKWQGKGLQNPDHGFKSRRRLSKE